MVRAASRIRASLLVALLALSSVAVAGRAGLRSALARPSAEDRRCASLEPAQRLGCFDRANRAATSGFAIRRRLAVFQKLVADGRMDDCHMPAHALGHYAAMAFDDRGRALRAGGTRCGGGYLHGVVQGAFHVAGATDAPGRVPGFCNVVAREPGLYSGCIHGLGHALLESTGRIDDALSACGTLNGDTERNRCTGGVMMQNSMQHVTLPEDQYIDAAPHACAALKATPGSRTSSLCHTQIGEIAMIRYGHDLPRAAKICEAIPDASGRAACLAGARTEWHAVPPVRR